MGTIPSNPRAVVCVSESPSTETLLTESGATREEPLSAANLLTRKSAVATAGGVLAQGLKFLVYLYIARTFSSTDFGSVAFANAINSFIYVISQFGLPVFGSRAVAASGRVESRLLLSVAACRAGLAVIATIAALGLLFFMPGLALRDYLLVAFFGLSNIPLAGLFDWAFQGLNRQAASAALNTVWQAFWLGLTYIGARAWNNILVVPIALCVAALAASLAGFAWLRFSGLLKAGPRQGPASLRDVLHTMKTGHLLGTGTILLSMLVWTDTITVRLLLGPQAAGWYAAGNRAALAVSWLVNSYMRGAFPLLCGASITSAAAFRQYFQRAYNELALLFIPGSVWGLFYAPDVILFLFKRQEYLAGVPVFRIFQIVMPMMVFNLLYGMGVLLAFHEDREYRRILALAALVLLIVCPVFTHLWGLSGAALATFLAYGVSLGLFQFRARRFVRPRHLEALLLPSVAGLAAGLVGKLLHAGLFLGLGLLFVAYGGLLFRHRRRMTEYSPA